MNTRDGKINRCLERAKGARRSVGASQGIQGGLSEEMTFEIRVEDSGKRLELVQRPRGREDLCKGLARRALWLGQE